MTQKVCKAEPQRRIDVPLECRKGGFNGCKDAGSDDILHGIRQVRAAPRKQDSDRVQQDGCGQDHPRLHLQPLEQGRNQICHPRKLQNINEQHRMQDRLVIPGVRDGKDFPRQHKDGFPEKIQNNPHQNQLSAAFGKFGGAVVLRIDHADPHGEHEHACSRRAAEKFHDTVQRDVFHIRQLLKRMDADHEQNGHRLGHVDLKLAAGVYFVFIKQRKSSPFQ